MAKVFVVIDPDSGEVVGPFASEAKAKSYFIRMAKNEGWADTLELIEKTGLPFQKKGDPFVFTEGRSEHLQLVEVSPPLF